MHWWDFRWEERWQTRDSGLKPGQEPGKLWALDPEIHIIFLNCHAEVKFFKPFSPLSITLLETLKSQEGVPIWNSLVLMPAS